MNSRFAYFYFMKNEPEKIGGAIGPHVEYWKKLTLGGYTGDPFADNSGGLICFEAESLEEAEKIASNDPFFLNGQIESRWIKEWLANVDSLTLPEHW